jgi:hypothetical protein
MAKDIYVRNRRWKAPEGTAADDGDGSMLPDVEPARSDAAA